MLLDPNINAGQYSTMYVGYWYEETMDSYLKGYCPKETNQTFLVRWLAGRSKDPAKDPQYQNVNTTLWCRPSYCTLQPQIIQEYKLTRDIY